DDPDLLAAKMGLDTVVAKAEAVGVPIYTIGFGDTRDFDESTLRAMAWPNASNYFRAHDAPQLENVLLVVRQALVNRLRITFCTDHRDWRMLTRLAFRVAVTLPDGRRIASPEVPWACTAMTACLPEGTLTPAESRALLDVRCPPDTPDRDGATFWDVVRR